jgi:HSP20 family molecular chaperone IbpA
MLIPSIFNSNFMDTFFDDFDRRPAKAASSQITLMRTDLKENDDKYQLEIELPGYQKEEVKAELQNGYLIISASKTENKEEKDGMKYVRRERYTGSCSRSFYVGDEMKQEDIKAKFDNGMLILDIPKHVEKPVEEKKYISID